MESGAHVRLSILDESIGYCTKYYCTLRVFCDGKFLVVRFPEYTKKIDYPDSELVTGYALEITGNPELFDDLASRNDAIYIEPDKKPFDYGEIQISKEGLELYIEELRLFAASAPTPQN